MKNANCMLFGLVRAAVPSEACLAQTTIDVAKITWEQLILMNVADPDHIAIWLNGHYNGKRNTTRVDVEQLLLALQQGDRDGSGRKSDGDKIELGDGAPEGRLPHASERLRKLRTFIRLDL